MARIIELPFLTNDELAGLPRRAASETVVICASVHFDLCVPLSFSSGASPRFKTSFALPVLAFPRYSLQVVLAKVVGYRKRMVQFVLLH